MSSSFLSLQTEAFRFDFASKDWKAWIKETAGELLEEIDNPSEGSEDDSGHNDNDNDGNNSHSHSNDNDSEQGSESPSKAPDRASPNGDQQPLAVGDPVRANYGGEGAWYVCSLLFVVGVSWPRCDCQKLLPLLTFSTIACT